MHIAILLVCILVLANVWPASVLAADFNAAGLVVDYGDGRISYAWVPFEEDELSGIDLLQRSGLDLVTVGFGGMGEGVCQIDDTGCPVGECRKRLCQTSDPGSPFWRLSQQTAPGEWTFANAGASASRVHSGEIQAWSWTGSDVTLPAISMDDLAERAGADISPQANASTLPKVALRTEGMSSSGDSGTSSSLAAAITGTVVVLGVGGFAIWRSRNVQKQSPS